MKVRLKYAKGGEARWLSQLDVARLWARAFRRARAGVVYTEGFSPHPKIAFSPALPVGVGGQAEFLDAVLDDGQVFSSLGGRLNDHLPRGLRVLETVQIAVGTRSLGASISVADYQVAVEGVEADIAGLTPDGVKAKKEFKFELLGRYAASGQARREAALKVRVLINTGAGALAEALVEAAAGKIRVVSIDRTALWVEADGKLEDPMAFGSE